MTQIGIARESFVVGRIADGLALRDQVRGGFAVVGIEETAVDDVAGVRLFGKSVYGGQLCGDCDGDVGVWGLRDDVGDRTAYSICFMAIDSRRYCPIYISRFSDEQLQS